MRSRGSLCLLLGAAALVLGGCGDGTGPGNGGGGLIAFAASTTADIDYDIYTVSTGGQELQRLTSGPANDYDPVWSNDGSEIYFTSNGRSETAHGIYVMRSDGTDLRLFAAHPRASAGGLSPDHAWVAYTDASGDLAVSRLDGGEAHVVAAVGVRLTCPGTLNPCNVDAADPHWSPDGSTIAFAKITLGRASYMAGTLYVVDSDGAALRQVSGGPASVNYPRWSSDGQRITVSSDGGYGGTAGNVWSVRPATLSWTPVTPYSEEQNNWMGAGNALIDGSAWSPDRQRLVYSTDTWRAPEFATIEAGLWTIGAGGGPPQMIHTGFTFYITPAWR